MPLDTVLLWLGLSSGVLLLARGAPGLWAAKAAVLVLAGAVGVATDPLAAGWSVGILWAVLIAIPAGLARLANWLLLAQRYAAALPVYGAVWLLHPERVYSAQVQLVRALMQARRGAFTLAIARFGHLVQNPRVPPETALAARLNKRRLEGRLDLFLEEVAWERQVSPGSTMMRLAALAALGRTDELVAVQTEHGGCLQGPQNRQSHVWASAMASLFVGTGRVSALERLFAGPLRRLPPDVRAFQLALARLAAGTGGADTHETLSRLASARDRDLALRASRTLAAPPAPVSLSPAQGAAVDAAEADLEHALQASRARPRLSRSPVTLVLIALNLAAFAAELASGGSEDASALRRLGALFPRLVVEGGQWWRVPAAMFLHLGWVHLSVNMLALAGLGRAVEQAFGAWRTLATYLAAGIGSMAGIVLLVRGGWMDDEWVVGASGAIMGLFGALVVDAVRSWRRDRSAAARLRLAGMLGLVVAQAALDAATPQVSFAGHALGGAIGMLAAAALGQPKAAVPALQAVASGTGAGADTASVRRLSRRRAALALPAAGVAIVAALAFPRRREQAEARAAQEAAASITPAQLAAIRRLRFVFAANVEDGAPTVDPWRPFGSADPLADLAAATGIKDAAALRRLYAEVMGRLPLFCARAQLAPGQYRVDGTLVEVSREQLRLVAALAWQAPDFDDGITPEDGAWPVASVDFKRPYGDMTYFEADMADALEIPVGADSQGRAHLPDGVVAYLDALHRSMATTLQAVVRYAAWPKAP